MDICGEVVKHKAFGKGKIVDYKNNCLTVLFEEGKLEKKFAYPSAFGLFLELESKKFLQQIEEDKSIIAMAEAELQKMKEDRAKALKAEEDEEIRLKNIRKKALAKENKLAKTSKKK